MGALRKELQQYVIYGAQPHGPHRIKLDDPPANVYMPPHKPDHTPQQGPYARAEPTHCGAQGPAAATRTCTSSTGLSYA